MSHNNQQAFLRLKPTQASSSGLVLLSRRNVPVRSSIVVTAYRSHGFPQTGPELRTPGESDDKGPTPGT
jgi:hypothetical protein